MLSRDFNLPAPVSGIDAYSALMGVAQSHALVLENWFPRTDALITRPGYVAHVTGFPNPVRRLHAYASQSGAESLFATTDIGIYNTTTAGAVGSAVMTLTNGYTISTSINTGSGYSYFFLVNGVDTLKQFDGTTWTSVATLGSTATSSYSYIEVYRQRLFFIKKNSLELEYLPSNSISGTPVNYPMGAYFRQGGYLVAMIPWTIDGGAGPDDHFVVISSKGEVAVFVGPDPAIWSFIGTYFIGRPLGAKSLTKYGGDVLILTETGVTPLSKAVQSTSIDRAQAFTQNIRSVFNAAAQSFSGLPGWEIIVDPIAPQVVVNIPATPVKKQAVMHSQTGAWALYSGWDANCFARVSTELYFGSATAVYRVNGNSDLGANITCTMLQAPSRLQYGQNKRVQLIRPYLSTTGGYAYNMGVATNFSDPREKTYFQKGTATPASVWGTGVFGTAVWSGGNDLAVDWQTVPDVHGLWKSLYLQVVTNNGRVTYYGSDIVHTPGGRF
jgi:hypothetical protein